MKAFEGKVVIVTGAARGLGRDYAKFFAQDGANVVLADLQGMDSALADANAQNGGGRSIAVSADITNRASVEALMARTKEEFGRIDILINNAGIWRKIQDYGLVDIPDDLWRMAWAINVDGTLLCYQAALPYMKEGGFGRIVNISSMAASGSRNSYGLSKNVVE
ncbi:MAG: SDR family oxidoreductase, partial [Caulobacterales bacterium]